MERKQTQSSHYKGMLTVVNKKNKGQSIKLIEMSSEANLHFLSVKDTNNS